MSETIQRVLGGTPKEPVLTFERNYRTDAEDLWRAITNPDRLARWFGRVDPVPAGVGDEFAVDLGGGGDDHPVGVITGCRRPELLRYDWRWPGEPTSEVAVVLCPDEQGTRLVLTHRLQERAYAANCGGDWEQMLVALAGALAADPVQPAGDPGTDQDSREAEAEGTRQWARLLELSGPDRELRIARTLPAPVDAVWHALTTEAGLSTWWWTGLGTSYRVDLRPGGRYRFESATGAFAVTGTYLEIDPEGHLAFSWIWQDEDGAGPTDRVDISLRAGDSAGTTAVELLHRGPWDEASQTEDYRLGWTSTLDALERTLSAH